MPSGITRPKDKMFKDEEKKLKDLNDFKNYSYLCPQEIKNLFNYHSLKQKHYG